MEWSVNSLLYISKDYTFETEFSYFKLEFSFKRFSLELRNCATICFKLKTSLSYLLISYSKLYLIWCVGCLVINVVLEHLFT